MLAVRISGKRQVVLGSWVPGQVSRLVIIVMERETLLIRSCALRYELRPWPANAEIRCVIVEEGYKLRVVNVPNQLQVTLTFDKSVFRISEPLIHEGI